MLFMPFGIFNTGFFIVFPFTALLFLLARIAEALTYSAVNKKALFKGSMKKVLQEATGKEFSRSRAIDDWMERCQTALDNEDYKKVEDIVLMLEPIIDSNDPDLVNMKNSLFLKKSDGN